MKKVLNNDIVRVGDRYKFDYDGSGNAKIIPKDSWWIGAIVAQIKQFYPVEIFRDEKKPKEYVYGM